MAYVVAARWTAVAGEEGRVMEIAKQLLAPSRGEAGCRYYQGTRDPADPRVFFFFEVYDDEAAFEAHRASEHVQQLVLGEVISLLKNRERWTYETID